MACCTHYKIYILSRSERFVMPTCCTYYKIYILLDLIILAVNLKYITRSERFVMACCTHYKIYILLDLKDL